VRFVDASVFLYAYMKPRRTLPTGIAEMKKAAKAVVRRIDSGEKVATSLTHISEVANILEASMAVHSSHQIIIDLIHSPSISIFEPTRENYVEAVELAQEVSAGLNDGVAYVLMKENGIDEIYSFDKHFDSFEGLKRIHA